MNSTIPICRVCLKTSLEYIDFETPFDFEMGTPTENSAISSDFTDQPKSYTYLDCFRACTRLEIEYDVPQSLCDACGFELKITYEFLEKAKKSDKILRDAIEKTKVCAPEQINSGKAEGEDEEVDCRDNTKKGEGDEISYQCTFCKEAFLSKFVLNLHKTRMHRCKTGQEATELSFRNEDSQEIESEFYYEENQSAVASTEDDNINGSQYSEENIELELLELGNNEVDSIHGEKKNTNNIWDHAVLEECVELNDNDLAINDCTDASCVKENFKSPSFTEEELIQEQEIRTSVFRCATCPSSFESRRLLMQHHWKIHKPVAANTCKICQKNISKPASMREHLQKEHSHVVQCSKCEYKCKELKLADHERRVHAENRDYECNICSKTFPFKGILNSHLKYHQNKEANIKSDACEICGKQYSTQHYLRQHMEIHRNKRELHRCNRCDKIYVSKTALENHMKMHNGETMECPSCGKQFARQYELKVHMRFHTRHYPFECEVCGKKFAIKGHLRTHMWRHQGLKLQCEECGKLFTSTKALHEHSFSHTEMPFPCSYCPKGYPSKQKYKVHLKTAHLIELNDEELKKISAKNAPKPLLRKKLTLVQADTVMKEVEIKSKEDEIESMDEILVELY